MEKDIFNFVLSEENEDDGNKEIDVRKLFDLDNLYLEFKEEDFIKRKKDGRLILEIFDEDTDATCEKYIRIENLGNYGDILSMACRLREFGYPIEPIKFEYGDRLSISCGVNLFQMKREYNKLLKK